MGTVLLVVQILVIIAMIITILIQPSSSDGLGGLGGGASSGSGLISSRTSANLLTKTTAILATLFFVNSLALAWLARQESDSRSIVEQYISDEQKPGQEKKVEQAPVPVEPSAPVAE